MTRILYFTDTIRMGGAERVLEDLAGGALDAGHEVVVLAPQPYLVAHLARRLPGLSARVFGDDGFRTAPTLAARGRSLLSQGPALARVMWALDPDVLHVSNGGHPGSGLCCLALPAARLAGVRRRVLSVHAVPRPREESHRQVQMALDRLVWSAADVVVGATAIVGRALVQKRSMPEGRFVEIPYGVPVPEGATEAAQTRADLGVADDELLALMVSATSDEQKGHGVLAAALADAPGVRAAIVGSDPPAAAHAAFRGPALRDRAAILGRFPSVGRFMHAADVIVVPSVADESLPLVVLEAMAAGKPVVASRLSGIPEAVIDGVTGRLFAPGDAAALAALLRELAAAPSELRELGRAGHQRWADRYSVDVMVRDTLALYGPPGLEASR